MLKVTWIAPLVPGLPELGWLTEMARMKKIPGVEVTTLEGPVYLDDVANILLKEADLVVWSGHGSNEGLIISDGETLPTDWLVAHVRQCAPRAIILASCGSQDRHDGLDSLAEAICLSGINAIGFPAMADDKTAADFTVEFTRTMSLHGESGKVGNAFKVAIGFIRKRSGRGTNGESTADGVFLSPGLRDTPFEIESVLAMINERLTHIEKSMMLRYDSASGETKKDAPGRASISDSGLRSVSSVSVTRGSIHKIRNI